MNIHSGYHIFNFIFEYIKIENNFFQPLEVIEAFPFSWNSYKINQTQDKVGVFVSIVSTKVPFKGTGKEYIGDDISEIASAVKVGVFSIKLLVS